MQHELYLAHQPFCLLLASVYAFHWPTPALQESGLTSAGCEMTEFYCMISTSGIMGDCQSQTRLTAGGLKAGKQPAEQASAEGRGLHDSLADPAVSKHVGITTKLAELLGVANADQVSRAFSVSWFLLLKT